MARRETTWYLKIDTGADVVNEPLEQEANSVDDLAHILIDVKISSGKNLSTAAISILNRRKLKGCVRITNVEIKVSLIALLTRWPQLITWFSVPVLVRSNTPLFNWPLVIFF